MLATVLKEGINLCVDRGTVINVEIAIEWNERRKGGSMHQRLTTQNSKHDRTDLQSDCLQGTFVTAEVFADHFRNKCENDGADLIEAALDKGRPTLKRVGHQCCLGAVRSVHW